MSFFSWRRSWDSGLARFSLDLKRRTTHGFKAAGAGRAL